MNPAALCAFLNNDMENFLAAATPGGIEAQEARGQRDLAKAANKLPIDMNPEDKAALESLGFVFGEKVEDIFLSCQFPEGWAVRPTTHSMHSDLVDPSGSVRGGVFYKAAFYDRNAHLNLKTRYRVDCDYEEPESSIFIADAKTGTHAHELGSVAYINRDTRRAMEKAGAEWLIANFPDHKNPLAYWEA